MTFLKKYKLILIGVVLGGIVGYTYYSFIGCSGGSCSITSKPLNSTVYFAVIGGLIFSMFDRKTKSENDNAKKNNNFE